MVASRQSPFTNLSGICQRQSSWSCSGGARVHPTSGTTARGMRETLSQPPELQHDVGCLRPLANLRNFSTWDA